MATAMLTAPLDEDRSYDLRGMMTLRVTGGAALSFGAAHNAAMEIEQGLDADAVRMRCSAVAFFEILELAPTDTDVIDNNLPRVIFASFPLNVS